MVFSQNYCYYFLQVAPLMCSLAIMCIQQYGKAGYKIYFPDLKKNAFLHKKVGSIGVNRKVERLGLFFN